MADYIKREDVLSLKHRLHNHSKDTIELYPVYVISPDAVEKIPSAGVVEVRHGKWEKVMCVEEHPKYTSYNPEWFCSECGQKYTPEFAQIVHFCYWCGARMDGE